MRPPLASIAPSIVYRAHDRTVKKKLDDDDVAFSTLLDVADRLAVDQSPKQQEELRQLKRALLGDAFSEGEYLEAMGADERARLPLPFAGVIRALKYIGVRRAGCRLWTGQG